MGMRFRKSVKICKGVRVNFSKSGTSLSLGGKGLTTNLGKKGATVTAGIPGTGLSFQTHLGSNSHNSTSHRTSSSKQTNSQRNTSTLPDSIRLHIDDNGKFTFYQLNGQMISDPSTIRKLKNLPQIQSEMNRLDTERRNQMERKLSDHISEQQHFLNIHKLSPMVSPLAEWETALANLHKRYYFVKEFDQHEESTDSIRHRLQEEAETTVKSRAFWRVKKLKEQYVETQLPIALKASHEKWLKAKEEFDAIEKQHELEQNLIYEQEYEQRRTLLQNAIDGDTTFIESAIYEWFSSCTLPVEINIDFVYNQETRQVSIDMDLPEIEDVPTASYSILANGNLKEKNKPQTVIRQEYAHLVFGLALFVVSNILNISPAITSVLISGYTQRRNKSGILSDDYIYSIRFQRTSFEMVDIQNVNPMDFCLQHENRCNTTSTLMFKTIIPFDS